MHGTAANRSGIDAIAVSRAPALSSNSQMGRPTSTLERERDL